MKTALTVPLFPSATDTSLTDSEGVASSSAIVPRPLSSASVAFTGLERLTVKVSSVSSRASPAIGTTIVRAVSPARKVSVPLAAAKSAGDVAVPPLVE